MEARTHGCSHPHACARLLVQGGYWCWDGPSCSARCLATPFACSSGGNAPVLAEEGIFSELPSGDVNPFSGTATVVFLKYCSSDSWLGDVGAGPSTFDYNFRGARIVNATVTALRALHGMGSVAGTQLVLGGCSAGGRGAIMLLDGVAQSLLGTGIAVSGFFDAAAWVDVEPQIAGLQSLQQQAALQMAFMNPAIPAACASLYTGTDSWKCIWPSYRLPLLVTPFFLNAASFDTFQIMYTTNNQPNAKSNSQLAFLDTFQAATLQLFAQLPASASIFSTSCLAHCLADSLEFFCLQVGGVTLAQAVWEWMESGVTWRNVSPCIGWACTSQCGSGPMVMWDPENVPATATPLCSAYYGAAEGNSGGAGAPQRAPAVNPTVADTYAAVQTTVQPVEASLSAAQQAGLASLTAQPAVGAPQPAVAAKLAKLFRV